jgi:hypothetical protein
MVIYGLWPPQQSPPRLIVPSESIEIDWHPYAHLATDNRRIIHISSRRFHFSGNNNRRSSTHHPYFCNLLLGLNSQLNWITRASDEYYHVNHLRWWCLAMQSKLRQMTAPLLLIFNLGHYTSSCLSRASTHSGYRDLTITSTPKKDFTYKLYSQHIPATSHNYCSYCFYAWIRSESERTVLHVAITHWTRSTVAAARTLRTYTTPHLITSLASYLAS